MSNYHNLISLKQIRKCTSRWICPFRLWIYLRNWKFIRYMVWQSDIYSLLLVCISGLECRSIQCQFKCNSTYIIYILHLVYFEGCGNLGAQVFILFAEFHNSKTIVNANNLYLFTNNGDKAPPNIYITIQEAVFSTILGKVLPKWQAIYFVYNFFHKKSILNIFVPTIIHSVVWCLGRLPL